MRRHIIELEMERLTKIARRDITDINNVVGAEAGAHEAVTGADSLLYWRDMASNIGSDSVGGEADTIVLPTAPSLAPQTSSGSASVNDVASGSASSAPGYEDAAYSGSLGLSVDSHDLDISAGSADLAVSVGSRGTDVSVGSAESGRTDGSPESGVAVGSNGLEVSVGSSALDVSVGSSALDISVGSSALDVSVGSGDADVSVGSAGVDVSVGSGDVDVSVGSADVDVSVGSSSVGDFLTHSSDPESSASVDTTVGSSDASGSTAAVEFASSEASNDEERSFEDSEGTPSPSTSIPSSPSTASPSPAAGSSSTTGVSDKAVSTVAPSTTEKLVLGETLLESSDSSSGDSVKVFSLAASSSSSVGSAAAAELLSTGSSGSSDSQSASDKRSSSGSSGSSDYEPYSSSYCRCKATECQNEYPGESNDATCESKLSDGSCPSGYKTCVSTDSYKVTTSTVTPNSVAEASFTLLASDIIGAFYNLGAENPMARGTNWWVTITLPTGWRFVAWENTSADVTLRDDDGDVSRAERIHSCSDVTDTSNCDSMSTHRFGFVDLMELLEGREDLMTSTSRGPIAFVLAKSIVTGTSASSSSVGVSVSLSYESSTGALKSAATSRRMRELAVTATGSTSSSDDFNALTLATMDLPPVQRGRLDSSLLWVDEDTDVLTLSFSTSTIIGPNSDNPEVCVDLSSSYCTSKGRSSGFGVSFGTGTAATYVQGGNPFLNLYADPGDTDLKVASENDTYFCVTDLLPSGVKTNETWEIRTTFTFQIQITDVVWSSDSEDDDEYTGGFQLPQLGEIVLIDSGNVLASDCAQTLVHTKTCTSLLTLLNGISFSGPTFYNDMTSISVMMIFVLAIIGNAIWISVSTNASSTSGTHIYYLLYAISYCFTWTMMTSVCFHWGTVLFHDVRQSRRFFMHVVYVLINVAFYGIQLFGVVSLTDLYKCAYDDYLKNPLYNRRLCSNDYCPDLQPTQWKYAVDDVCKDVAYSDWFFPISQGGQLLIFLSAVALLVLGAFVIRRGVRLIQQSGSIFDDHVVKVMKKSLITYLVVILAIALVLGTSCVMNSILHWKNWSIDSIVWYVFSVWLPILVPPVGFLLLQWNPRLHGMNWNPSLHVKDPHLLHRTMSSASEKGESGKFAATGESDLLSDGWAGILRFPDTEYNPIGQESVDGTQNVLALSVQLVSSVPIAHACFVELYVAENASGDAGENDVTGEDYFDDLPLLSYHRSSISSLIQSGLHQEGILSRRSHSHSLLATTSTPHPVSNSATQWSRVGFTETVLPTLVSGGLSNGGGSVTQIATFLSVLQMPVMPANPLLRFVVYEIPETAPSPDSDPRDSSRQLLRASSRQLDERARSARVSGMGLAPPSRPKVFCEFSCACSDMLAADEVNLVARQVSHRSRPSIPTFISDGASSDSPTAAATTSTTPAPEADPSAPRLRVKSMTVSPRQLKENTGFYITKSFQFAEGDEMVIEDLTESVLTNELPRQYLELLVSERAEDLSRAQAEASDFEARCKSGLVGGLYDNLIEQIQGENDQTVVQAWLDERVQQRKMYVEALRECHQLCIDRAGEGLNFKASTEKKSLVLRFLPINLHVQDVWVGPTADLRSQRSRRTSPNVKAYPTVTVGAFSAHCFKFRHGGSILSLRAALQKRSLSRVQSDMSDKSGSEQVDWSSAATRANDETRWHLTSRLDMCLSQALTTLVTSFCRQLELSLQHPTDRRFLRTIDSVGFLFQVESLLSTQGKEIGMLEDFAAAVDALRHVTLVLDTSPPKHLPPTLLNLHMKNTSLPSVVSVRLSRGASKGTFTVAVGVRCSESVLASMPSNLRSGGAISVTPVIFTQGINEMQTLANNASSRKTTLQDIINRKSFALLTRYPDAVLTPMTTVAPLLASLEERIAAASKRQVVKAKHPKIIQESSRLCRLLGAGRVTSCKSAKDRTSMSVTLEQVRLLSEHHGLPEEFVVRTVSTMRSNGVRLENVLKNTGKRQYAFNALQRSLLPEEYKCPEGTYGRGNVS
ncbi:hypothetical protein BBJ28_00004349 [Nothophytophthora sp. Chile5]|nr:hypothetical protein BBJ28_00004349 [Nothophytophthora sp. Chile5]